MQTPEQRREYDRKWSKLNRERRYKLNSAWRRKRAMWLREYKKILWCNRCGEAHPGTLQFHHSGGKEKNIGSVGMTWSEKRLMIEINKCEVLCANCHAKEHYHP